MIVKPHQFALIQHKTNGCLDIMITHPCHLHPLRYTPLLYSKTGVYRGIHYFLIIALKYYNFSSENYLFYSCEILQFII